MIEYVDGRPVATVPYGWEITFDDPKPINEQDGTSLFAQWEEQQADTADAEADDSADETESE